MTVREAALVIAYRWHEPAERIHMASKLLDETIREAARTACGRRRDLVDDVRQCVHLKFLRFGERVAREDHSTDSSLPEHASWFYKVAWRCFLERVRREARRGEVSLADDADERDPAALAAHPRGGNAEEEGLAHLLAYPEIGHLHRNVIAKLEEQYVPEVERATRMSRFREKWAEVLRVAEQPERREALIDAEIAEVGGTRTQARNRVDQSLQRARRAVWEALEGDPELTNAERTVAAVYFEELGMRSRE